MNEWERLWVCRPESLIYIRGGGSEILGSNDQWLENVKIEGYRLQELEKKHYQYALDANNRLGECKQKLINIHKGLRELLEYNYMNLCRTDVENLLDNNNLHRKEIGEENEKS